MADIAMKIVYALFTVFIVLNIGLIFQGVVRKIGARVGRRYGVRVYQPYIDLVKNYAKRTTITHGVMFYLGPAFRLTGGIGLLLFMPVIFGAGESGHPYAAIGVSRGLSQVTAVELPLTLGLIAIAMQYQSLSLTEIVTAQQGSFLNWTFFTNPLAAIAIMLAFLGAMGRSPFDVVTAPQEIPIGPPTEFHSGLLGVLQTNRAIFPIAKTILFMNILFGGASNWFELLVKVFFIYMWSVFVGLVYPRFRVDQSIRWYLGIPLIIGLLAILMI